MFQQTMDVLQGSTSNLTEKQRLGTNTLLQVALVKAFCYSQAVMSSYTFSGHPSGRSMR